MKKGFSLIEMLIVVAIIGILVAIGLPYLDKKKPAEVKQTVAPATKIEAHASPTPSASPKAK